MNLWLEPMKDGRWRLMGYSPERGTRRQATFESYEMARRVFPRAKVKYDCGKDTKTK